MNASTRGDPLRHAAERAGAIPFFLAAPLLAYARLERLDDDGLAAALGCSPDTLSAVLLCRRPMGEGAMFRADVEAIASRFGLQAGRLVQLLRKADALAALEQEPAGLPGGLLAAARDRDDNDVATLPAVSETVDADQDATTAVSVTVDADQDATTTALGQPTSQRAPDTDPPGADS